jgi:hypothetical protein
LKLIPLEAVAVGSLDPKGSGCFRLKPVA